MRMVSDGRKYPDVVVSADAGLLRDRLYDTHTTWDVSIASNAVGIAYASDTRFGERLEAGDPWYEVARDADPGALAISDPDLDPSDTVPSTRFDWQSGNTDSTASPRPSPTPPIGNRRSRSCSPASKRETAPPRSSTGTWPRTTGFRFTRSRRRTISRTRSTPIATPRPRTRRTGVHGDRCADRVQRDGPRERRFTGRRTQVRPVPRERQRSPPRENGFETAGFPRTHGDVPAEVTDG